VRSVANRPRSGLRPRRSFRNRVGGPDTKAAMELLPGDASPSVGASCQRLWRAQSGSTLSLLSAFPSEQYFVEKPDEAGDNIVNRRDDDP
jgi:hypothetical protein